MASVYVLVNRLSGKVYVGKTGQTVEKRWKGHVYEAFSGSSRYICRAIRKYTPQAFDVEEVEVGVTEERAFKLERAWIKRLRAKHPRYGYNLSDGGEGASGCRRSEKARARVGAANRAKWAETERRYQEWLGPVDEGYDPDADEFPPRRPQLIYPVLYGRYTSCYDIAHHLGYDWQAKKDPKADARDERKVAGVINRRLKNSPRVPRRKHLT